MKAQFSSSLLFPISKGVSSKNPTWSLLLANEYLEKEDPLRKALVQRARINVVGLEDCSIENQLFEAACDGKKMLELPTSIQKALRGSSKTSLRSSSKNIMPTPKKRKGVKVRLRNELTLATPSTSGAP